MVDSKNITATKGRLQEGLDKVTSNMIDKTVPSQINEAVDKVKIRTGVITKFYPYIDKAEVKLDFSGKKVLCKILHRCGGDLIDFYTPSAYETDYDDNLHEKYIIPMASQNVCVLHIHDSDSEENLILGYYMNEEIVGYNPAKPGNIKIMGICQDSNEYWFKFGFEGFKYKTHSAPSRQIGDVHTEEGVEEVSYANSKNVYTKEEVDKLIEDIERQTTSYTKEEIDAMLEVIDNKLQDHERRIVALEEIINNN